jgi:Cu-Zn family superoxide dismutase
MTARHLGLSLLVGALIAVAGALPADAQRPEVYILPGEGVFPEGVAFDEQTQTFYVSSTGGGAVFRGTLHEEAAEVFLPAGEDGRTFATGLEADGGHLFVSGGPTGKMFVYDAISADLIADFTTSQTPTFINDVAVIDGDAFFTDSLSPVLYRVFNDGSGWQMEEWLDFTGTPFEYVMGFNANGIEATPDGQYLVIIQSMTGKLFRVTVTTQEVLEIDLGGTMLTAGDGLVLRGRTLWVVRNSLELIAEVQLSDDLSSGELVAQTTDPSFMFPTTADIANGRLLVVNSQFDQRMGTPVEPFTVSSVPVP